MVKYIKVKMENRTSRCPICGTINSHLTGNDCGHVYKITDKGIVIYNNNITIVKRDVTGDEQLTTNQYYALMVMGYLGLECTSEKMVYISKNYHKRHDLLRGRTFVVSVKDNTKCCEL